MKRNYPEYDLVRKCENEDNTSDYQTSGFSISLPHASGANGPPVSKEHEQQAEMEMNPTYYELQAATEKMVSMPNQALTHASFRSLLRHPLVTGLLSLVIVLLLILSMMVFCLLQSSDRSMDHRNTSDTECRTLQQSLKDLQKELCDTKENTTCKLCPLNWIFNRGKCYYISDEGNNWEISRNNCHSNKSELAEFEQQNDKDFFVQKLKEENYWIGKKKIDGAWSWVTGNNFTDSFSNGPNMINHCPTFFHPNISTDPCNNPNKSICEKNASDFSIFSGEIQH